MTAPVIRYPAGTPAEISDGYKVVDQRGADVVVACVYCHLEYGIRCGGEATVLPCYVRLLAGHLWRGHNLPVIEWADGRKP